MSSSSNKSPDDSVVVLGMHADNTLNVFVRDADQQLHQAARITTRNGVDPMAMTTIMADLTDAFGWRQIVSGPAEVPQLSRELPRGNRTAVAAAAVRATPPKAPTPESRPSRRGTRRTPADMVRQDEAILELLDGVDRNGAIGTPDIINHVRAEFGLPASVDPNVRRCINRLLEAGRVGQVVDEGVLSGGRARHRWYGVRLVLDDPRVWTEAQASVALDGDTMS